MLSNASLCVCTVPAVLRAALSPACPPRWTWRVSIDVRRPTPVPVTTTTTALQQCTRWPRENGGKRDFLVLLSSPRSLMQQIPLTITWDLGRSLDEATHTIFNSISFNSRFQCQCYQSHIRILPFLLHCPLSSIVVKIWNVCTNHNSLSCLHSTLTELALVLASPSPRQLCSQQQAAGAGL